MKTYERLIEVTRGSVQMHLDAEKAFSAEKELLIEETGFAVCGATEHGVHVYGLAALKTLADEAEQEVEKRLFGGNYYKWECFFVVDGIMFHTLSNEEESG